ncbi:hypothetical protein D3C84_628400 [compost metagenome]
MRAEAADHAVVLLGLDGEVPGKSTGAPIQWVKCVEPFIEEVALQGSAPGIVANAVDPLAALAAPGLRQSLRVFLVKRADAFGGQGIERSDRVLWQVAVATQQGQEVSEQRGHRVGDLFRQLSRRQRLAQEIRQFRAMVGPADRGH